MNYLLVSPENLEGKYNYQFAERLPDGRVILPISVAKMITGLKGVDMVGIEELRLLKLQDNQVEGEVESESESSSDEGFNESESSSDEGFNESESSSDEGFSESESSIDEGSSDEGFSDEQTNEESEVTNE